MLFTANVFCSFGSNTKNFQSYKRLIFDTLGINIINTYTDKTVKPSSLAMGLFFVPTFQYKLIKGLYIGVNLNIGINYIDYTGSYIRAKNQRDELTLQVFDLIENRDYKYYYQLSTTMYPSINLGYRF